MMPNERKTEAVAPYAVVGGIAGLAALKLVMLTALFSAVPPHPPQELAPLFGASLALSTLALALLQAESRWFLAPTLLVLIESTVSYGPQKFFIGQSIAIYPAVAVGTSLILLVAIASWAIVSGTPSSSRQTAR